MARGLLMRHFGIFVAIVLSSLTLRAETFPETQHVTAVHYATSDSCSPGACKTTYTIEGYMKDGAYTIEYFLTCDEVYQNDHFAVSCPAVHAGHDYFVMRKEGLVAFRPSEYLGGPTAKNRAPFVTLEREVPKQRP